MKLLIVQLPPFSCYFIPLRSKYSPEISVLKHPQSVIFQLGAIISSEPDISVSIVSGYGLDDRAIVVRSPAEAKGFFQTGSGAYPASCTIGTGGPFPGAKARSGLDADHSTPSSAEVENE
jgi:hypothetical protein